MFKDLRVIRASPNWRTPSELQTTADQRLTPSFYLLFLGLKEAWLNGFSLCWRIFLLGIIVRFAYGMGMIAAVLIAGLFGDESLTEPFLGIFALIGILLFPVVVSWVAEGVDLETSKIDFPLTRKIKARRRAVD